MKEEIMRIFLVSAQTSSQLILKYNWLPPNQGTFDKHLQSCRHNFFSSIKLSFNRSVQALHDSIIVHSKVDSDSNAKKRKKDCAQFPLCTPVRY
jgi:hypothetical protein